MDLDDLDVCFASLATVSNNATKDPGREFVDGCLGFGGSVGSSLAGESPVKSWVNHGAKWIILE